MAMNLPSPSTSTTPLFLYFLIFITRHSSHSLPTVSETQLIPDGFSCTRDMPRQMGIYSTPPNSNLVKVDLIHIFCGQISCSSSSASNISGNNVRVGGFHARPGDSDPNSATTVYSELIRSPPNIYGYSIYKYPYIYDSQRDMYVKKNTGSISSIWPTVLSMEDITQIITKLVYVCRYIYLHTHGHKHKHCIYVHVREVRGGGFESHLKQLVFL